MYELRDATRLISALVVITFATPTYSQTLEQQEQLNQFDKAISKIDELRTLVDTMGKEKRLNAWPLSQVKPSVSAWEKTFRW
jgi:hypothetical protein